MSLNSSPNRSTPSSYESYYDPSYTGDISSKMYVPDKISVIEGFSTPEHVLQHQNDIKSRMNVPERIIVAGDNKHIAVRDTLPELRFDALFSQPASNLILNPPPDILTVDEYPYPDVKPTQRQIRKVQQPKVDVSINGGNDLNDSSLSCAPEEEVALLRKQLRHLTRRVLTIEQENQQRQQREVVLYALGVAYFFFKGLVWLQRHF